MTGVQTCALPISATLALTGSFYFSQTIEEDLVDSLGRTYGRVQRTTTSTYSPDSSAQRTWLRQPFPWREDVWLNDPEGPLMTWGGNEDERWDGSSTVPPETSTEGSIYVMRWLRLPWSFESGGTTANRSYTHIGNFMAAKLRAGFEVTLRCTLDLSFDVAATVHTNTEFELLSGGPAPANFSSDDPYTLHCRARMLRGDEGAISQMLLSFTGLESFVPVAETQISGAVLDFQKLTGLLGLGGSLLIGSSGLSLDLTLA